MEAIILASGSPRRGQILTQMGVAFEKHAAEVDEHCALGAREAVAELSQRKAQAVAAQFPGRVVLAADTLVALDNQPLGKPKDEEDACRMLERLSGREHQVYTGVCVMDAQGRAFHDVDASDVCFRRLTKEEIRAYVQTGEPMDKAGAYALQGGAGPWVTEVRGSRSNVIGLPWELTRKLLLAAGVEVPVTKEQDGMMKHGADST
ncbi:MAG TPA: septum formation protein Maf [Candidatus Egerieenecus merdigallinarum]|nr:septum formation protein Maf [Candidatus Egerieenecus merdigallinarum]